MCPGQRLPEQTRLPEFKFVPGDIKRFEAVVKHMNTVDIADATATFYAAFRETKQDQARLLAVSLECFQVHALGIRAALSF